MNTWKKTKAERRAWWRKLTPEEQSKYLDKIIDRKMAARRKKRQDESVRDAERNCKTCFHGITKSCQEPLEIGFGCASWWSPREPKVTVLPTPEYNYWDHHGNRPHKYARRKRNEV